MTGNSMRFKALFASVIATNILCSSIGIVAVAKSCEFPKTVQVEVTVNMIPSEEQEVPQKKTVKEVEPKLTSLGEFRLTAYCSCEICCGKWAKYNKTKSGTTPEQGRTIAVDEDQIPLGSSVIIDGIEYIAEDTGSAIKENCIDVYFGNHEDAKEFGVQYKEVFVREVIADGSGKAVRE